MKLLQALANVFRIPDLRRRLIFMLLLLTFYRLGSYVTVPSVNVVLWEQFLDRMPGSIFGFFDVLAGGNIRRMSIFALGIIPYVFASIMASLLAAVIPSLEAISRAGELGRQKITELARYLTVGFSVLISFGMAIGLEGAQNNVVLHPGWGFILLTVISLTAGATLIMWFGEQITDRGIGNGMSLIIFTGIVAFFPNAIGALFSNVFITRQWNFLVPILLAVMFVVMVALIVVIEKSERRIPVQYAKRIIGRRVMGGQSSTMPMKMNGGGVIPVIFASSILAFPQTISNTPFIKNSPWLSSMFGSIRYSEPLYLILFIVLLIFFCFFYVSITINPNEAAATMQKYGGFIPGIRPGKSTADYLTTVLTRISFVGAVYLSILCIIPGLIISGIHLQHLPLVGPFIGAWFPRFILEGIGGTFFFAGASLLIVVGVAMDTLNQIESQLIHRHYDGFSPPRGGAPRGRRAA